MCLNVFNKREKLRTTTETIVKVKGEEMTGTKDEQRRDRD